jgi:nucleotide-binding universal stress UspA family protein
MYDTILVATDSSEESRAALAHAVDLAGAVDATVHAVTVLEVRGNPMEFGVGEVDALNDAAESLLTELRAAHDGRSVSIESQILRGKPASTLLEHADAIEADIIVAGQRGAGGITGALLGSTTDRLARLTDRPLVIVPAESDGDPDDD